MQRWVTYGIAELHKELEHYERRCATSPLLPALREYVARREAENAVVYKR